MNGIVAMILRLLDATISAFMRKIEAEEEYLSIKRKANEAYPQLNLDVPEEQEDDSSPYNPDEHLVPADEETVKALEPKIEIKPPSLDDLKITDLRMKNFTFDKSHPAYKKIIKSCTYKQARIFPNYPDAVDRTECCFLTMLFPLQLALVQPLPEEIYEPILDLSVKRGHIQVKTEKTVNGTKLIENSCFINNPDKIVVNALEILGMGGQFRMYQVGRIRDNGKPVYWNKTCEELGHNFSAMCGITERGGTHWRTGDKKIKQIFDPWKKDAPVKIVREEKQILYYFQPNGGAK
jgi:hypothetical protein